MIEGGTLANLLRSAAESVFNVKHCEREEGERKLSHHSQTLSTTWRVAYYSKSDSCTTSSVVDNNLSGAANGGI